MGFGKHTAADFTWTSSSWLCCFSEFQSQDPIEDFPHGSSFRPRSPVSPDKCCAFHGSGDRQQVFSKYLLFYSTCSSFTRVASVAHSSFWEVLIPKARKDEAKQVKVKTSYQKG